MSTQPSTEEKDLLIKLREGDYAAFEVIYHRYKRRLAGNLLRMVKSDTLVDEVLQDIFLKLWKHRASIDVVSS